MISTGIAGFGWAGLWPTLLIAESAGWAGGCAYADCAVQSTSEATIERRQGKIMRDTHVFQPIYRLPLGRIIPGHETAESF
ncbi:MAG TPA: hypothetical protein VGI99_09885 [Gemmataceae bacterium]